MYELIWKAVGVYLIAGGVLGLLAFLLEYIALRLEDAFLPDRDSVRELTFRRFWFEVISPLGSGIGVLLSAESLASVFDSWVPYVVMVVLVYLGYRYVPELFCLRKRS